MDTTLPFGAPGHAVEQAKPWIERFARVGFVAKAILYITIGGLAATAALGSGGRTTDSHGALKTILQAPFGRLLLGVIAFGLLGYALWRIIDGIHDPENRGHGPKGIALRIGSIGRGVIHLALAGTAASLAVWQSGKSDEGRHEHWTARAMETPGGIYVLWGLAGALLGYGLWQLYCAVRAKLSKQLRIDKCSAAVRGLLVGISRFGIAARGIVFGTVGILLGRAAYRHDPREAGGLGESLRELSGLGMWPFLGIAIGLAAYGVYEIVEARFRKIRMD